MSNNVLHLGCGEDYHSDAWNVDINPHVEPDEIYNLEELPWPWDSESYDEIRAYHLLEHLDNAEKAMHEAARLLRPGGKLEVKVPIGTNALADPDHVHQWTWRTPEFYTGKRHWDTDIGLNVESRSVSLNALHPYPPERAYREVKWRLALATVGPGQWCFNLGQSSGEFTVVFRKP